MAVFLNSKQFNGRFRRQRLLANLKLNNLKSILYVGARPNRIDHIDLFPKFDCTILEIWGRNVENLRKRKCADVVKKNLSVLNSVKIIKGDINDYCDGQYDIVMWWHGPEHVRRDIVENCINNCIKMSNKYVVLGCPWGDYKEHHFGNPHEDHISSYQPDYFEKLGFIVEVMGQEGPGSNILSILKK